MTSGRGADRWTLAWALAFAAIAAGTASPGPPPRDRTAQSACTDPALGALVPPPVPPGAPTDAAYDPLRGFDPDVDLGIGYLTSSDREDIGPKAVRLPLFRDAGGTPFAWILDGWLVPEGREPRALGAAGLVETGYEIPSLIVFAARADGWVRVRFAAGGGGVAWTNGCFFGLGNHRLEVRRWDRRFLADPQAPLYFRREARHALRDGPSESAGRVGEVPAGPTTYALYPREVRGDWMRVEMSEPSDYCADPAPDVPRVEGWVRWRDRGALQLWYFTRGC